MAALRMTQRVYRKAKGKGAAVLNHKTSMVLRLSMSKQVASRKLDMWSLHQKLAAGKRQCVRSVESLCN